MAAKLYGLSNGVRVIIDEVPHTRMTSIGLYVAVGARHEIKKNNGVAHFLEHMMFKGTKKRGVGQIDAEAAALGTQLEAETGYDSTFYYITGLATETSAMIELVSDMICHAALPQKEIKNESGAILSELREGLDDMEDCLYTAAQLAAYPDQPLGAQILGPEENIKNMSRKTLKKFKDDHYHAGNLIVSVAGNVNVPDVLQALEEGLKDIPSGKPSSCRKAVYVGNSFHEEVDAEHVYLMLQFNSCTQNDPDDVPADIMARILGEGPSSRLYQQVREKHGLVYSINAQHSSDPDSGLFQVYVESSRKNMKAAIPLICEELRKAAVEGFTEEEVKKAKASCRTAFARAADAMQGRMKNTVLDFHHYGRILPMEECLAEIDEKTTPASVQKAAKRIFSGMPSVISIGPGKPVTTPDKVAKALSL